MALEDAVNPMQGVSGPGPFSKRVDLAFKPDQYGQGVEMAQQMAGAPLAKSPDVRGATRTEINQAIGQEPVTSLYAPTTRPNEPITTGIDMGAGPGSQILSMSKSATKTSDTLAKLLPFDTTGDIAILYQEAVARGD